MEKERSYEIAYPVLRYKLRKEGISFETDFSATVARLAKEENIPVDEAMTFAEILYQGLLNDCLHLNTPLPQMNEVRRNELAYMYLKRIARTNGVRLKEDLRRTSGTVAKAIGITTDEMVLFTKTLVKDAFDL